MYGVTTDATHLARLTTPVLRHRLVEAGSGGIPRASRRAPITGSGAAQLDRSTLTSPQLPHCGNKAQSEHSRGRTTQPSRKPWKPRISLRKLSGFPCEISIPTRENLITSETPPRTWPSGSRAQRPCSVVPVQPQKLTDSSPRHGKYRLASPQWTNRSARTAGRSFRIGSAPSHVAECVGVVGRKLVCGVADEGLVQFPPTVGRRCRKPPGGSTTRLFPRHRPPPRVRDIFPRIVPSKPSRPEPEIPLEATIIPLNPS